MNLKYTQQEEILLQLINSKDYQKTLFKHSCYSIITHIVPHLCHIVWIRLLFLTYGQQYTQIYSRIFVFEELITHAFPTALAYSAAIASQLYLGQSLSNISQTQVSHFFMLIISFQLILIFFVVISISISPNFVDFNISQKLLFVESDDIKIVSRYIIIKLTSEPVLYAFARLSPIFMIAEGRNEIACILSVFQSVLELICISIGFLITIDQQESEEIFNNIVYSQLFSKSIFTVIYLSILTFLKNSRKNQFIYFQLSKRYIFPINWTTIYRMLITSISFLLTYSSPYVFTILALKFQFKVSNVSDIMNSLNLFSLVLVCLITASVNSTLTFHSYFIGRNDLTKAREVQFFVFKSLLIWDVIVIIALLLSKIDTSTLFANTKFSEDQALAASQNYMWLIYIVTVLLSFHLFSLYLLAVKFYWILGTTLTGITYSIGIYSIIITQQFADYSPDLIMISLLPFIGMGTGGIITIIGYILHERKLIIQFGNNIKGLKSD